MNNFSFEIFTKCLINDAMRRAVETNVRGACSGSAPFPLGPPRCAVLRVARLAVCVEQQAEVRGAAKAWQRGGGGSLNIK